MARPLSRDQESRDFPDFFISPLPHSVTKDDLIRQFRLYRITVDRINIRERDHDRTRFAFVTAYSVEDFNKIRELGQLEMADQVINMRVSREKTRGDEENNDKARLNYLLAQTGDLGINLPEVLAAPSPNPSTVTTATHVSCTEKYHAVNTDTKQQVKLSNTLVVDPVTNETRDVYAIEADPLSDAPFDDIRQNSVKFADITTYYRQSGIRAFDNYHQSFDVARSQLEDVLRDVGASSEHTSQAGGGDVSGINELLKSLHLERSRAREPSSVSNDSGFGATARSSVGGPDISSNSYRARRTPNISTDSGVGTPGTRTTQNSGLSAVSSSHSLLNQSPPTRSGKKKASDPATGSPEHECRKKTRSTVSVKGLKAPTTHLDSDSSEDATLCNQGNTPCNHGTTLCAPKTASSPITPATSTTSRIYDDPYYFRYFKPQSSPDVIPEESGRTRAPSDDSSDDMQFEIHPVVSKSDDFQSLLFDVPMVTDDFLIPDKPRHICRDPHPSRTLDVPVTHDLISFSPEPESPGNHGNTPSPQPLTTEYSLLDEDFLYNSLYSTHDNPVDHTTPDAIETTTREYEEDYSRTTTHPVTMVTPPPYGVSRVTRSESVDLLSLFSADLDQAIRDKNFEGLEGVILQVTQILVDMVDSYLISEGEVDRDTAHINQALRDAEADIAEVKELLSTLDGDVDLIEEIKETNLAEAQEHGDTIRAELWSKKIANVLQYEHNISGLSTNY